MTDAKPAHKRILLKLSGEALMGDDPFGINLVPNWESSIVSTYLTTKPGA